MADIGRSRWGGVNGPTGPPCATSLEYSPWLLEHLDSLSGGVCGLLRSLMRPSPRLYIRVNTLLTSTEEYLELVKNLGFRRDEELPEALWAPVEGPLKVRVYDKIVVADKRASESVLMGSDLYAPGVVEARGVKRGDLVTIVAPNGAIVGSGVSFIDGRVRPGARGLAVRVTEPMYRAPRVTELPGSGRLVYGQSLPSMYVARMLSPKPGELILDMTAAPGGKVSHVAQLVGPRARIVAVDRPSKAPALRRNLRMMGMDWVMVLGADSRYLSVDYPTLAGRVDAIILDPPCTNLGVVPKVYDRKCLSDVVAARNYQVQFVREAYRLLRKGGRLIYSTCTLTSLENDSVVEYALGLGFELEDPEYLPRRGDRGEYGVRFYPHKHGTPGFFVSYLLVKKGP